jgi:hypothetical protein
MVGSGRKRGVSWTAAKKNVSESSRLERRINEKAVGTTICVRS